MNRAAPRTRIDISRPLSEQPAFLTFADCAALLGKSIRTISAWESRGLIHASRPCGGTPIVSRLEIERILREGGPK